MSKKPTDYDESFDPREAAETVKQTARTARERVEDYLFGTFACDCGARCEPSERFVEEQARVCQIWDCPNCGSEYYRESPVDDEQLQPRRR